MLAFEGQSFVEREADDRQYWIEINDAERARAIKLLRPLGWDGEVDPFEAEFWGEINWTGRGWGHFGMFGGVARVIEITSVWFSPIAPRENCRVVGSLREQIKRSCLQAEQSTN